jgi:hypothetical protein
LAAGLPAKTGATGAGAFAIPDTRNRGAGGRRRSGVKNHFHAAQMKRLAVFEIRILNPGAVDERAVGGTQVLDRRRTVINDNLTMRAGNRRIANYKIVGITATETIRAWLELNFPSIRLVWIDDQSAHGNEVQGC